MAIGGWDRGDKWSFIVDTDSYAGNFERQLCAYVIGTVAAFSDPIFAGRAYLRMFEQECTLPLDELSDTRVADPGDDDVHPSPCDLAPTPGWSNNGKGKTYQVRPNSKRYGYKYPAYNSVAIFLRRRPTEEELHELVKRAVEFTRSPKVHQWETRPNEILGCRLVKEAVVVMEEVAVLPVTSRQSAVTEEPAVQHSPTGWSPDTAPTAVYAGSLDSITKLKPE